MPENALGFVAYDFKDIPDERAEWIWKGYLAAGNMTVLAAPPKAGKSTLLFHLLQCLRDGQEFLGLESGLRGGNVLLFTEESNQLLAQRRNTLGDLPLHVVGLQPGLSWPKIIAYTKYKAQQGTKLVILDTVSRFWPVQNEGDAVQVLQALDPMLRIVRTQGFSLLLIHHTRKGGGAEGNAMRGSNALLGSADIGVELSRITPWDKSNRRRLDALSRYGETPDTLIVEKVGDAYVVSDGASIEKEVMQIISFEGETTAEQLEEATGKALRTCQKILAEMTARGVLERTGSGGPRSPYKFTLRSVAE